MSKKLKVLQLTDIHLLASPDKTLVGIDTEASFRATLALAIQHVWPPDLILLTGDLAQDPSTASYQRLVEILAPHDIPCYCLAGNHDDFGLMRAVLNQKKFACPDRIDAGCWQIILLNTQLPGSEGGHLAPQELEKLERHLNSHSQQNTLIALHHHPVAVGSQWLDTMVVDNRDAFFAILKNRPQVRAILCGHIHQQLDILHQGIRLLGSPSTCFQFKPASPGFSLDALAPGCRWLTLSADGGIETEILRLQNPPAGLDFNQAGY